jgi:hypothetical protein
MIADTIGLDLDMRVGVPIGIPIRRAACLALTFYGLPQASETLGDISGDGVRSCRKNNTRNHGWHERTGSSCLRIASQHIEILLMPVSIKTNCIGFERSSTSCIVAAQNPCSTVPGTEHRLRNRIRCRLKNPIFLYRPHRKLCSIARAERGGLVGLGK